MNKKLLLDTICFPIKAHHMYIFGDNSSQIIADLVHGDFDRNNGYTEDVHVRNICAKIEGEYKKPSKKQGTEYTLKDGIFYYNNVPVMRVRGWGRIQYMDDPEKRQDNVAEYLLLRLNG